MNNMPCIVTRDLDAQQGIWDAQAEEAAARDEQFERVWNELDAALAAGILSDESYDMIRSAMDEDMKR